MRCKLLQSETGVALPLVVILMFALLLTGMAFLQAGFMENRLAMREIDKNAAFYLAEGGLDRTAYNLKEEFINGNMDWADGNINGLSVGEADGEGWRDLNYESSSLLLGEGSYLAKVKYVDSDEIWVRSYGTVDGNTKIVQVHMRAENISPWDNAIFAGAGAAGQVINGNARIHGKVHLLGEGLAPTDLAADMSGGSGIRNNYEGLPAELAAIIPPCPQTVFNGETIDSLNAILRVKHGQVGLNGTAVVGEADVVGNTFKETVDRCYVTDGWAGNQGDLNVYSDNETTVPYDLADSITFPSLLDPYGIYATYIDYLSANSLHLSINKINSTVASFSDSNAFGSIDWDQATGILEVNGIIFIDGNHLDLVKKHETIIYRGRGSIVCAHESGGAVVGDIDVHGDFLAEADFPVQNVIGIIGGSVGLGELGGETHMNMSGPTYAENEILSRYQNDIAGVFVSNYFNMGDQVPAIYQVPALSTNLPPGMVELGAPVWSIALSEWSEVTT